MDYKLKYLDENSRDTKNLYKQMVSFHPSINRLTSMWNVSTKPRSTNICCTRNIISASSHCQLLNEGRRSRSNVSSDVIPDLTKANANKHDSKYSSELKILLCDVWCLNFHSHKDINLQNLTIPFSPMRQMFQLMMPVMK